MVALLVQALVVFIVVLSPCLLAFDINLDAKHPDESTY